MRPVEIRVADYDVCAFGRPALVQIQSLPRYVAALILAANDRGFFASSRCAQDGPLNRDFERNVQPHRCVPQSVELRSHEEDAVEQQNRIAASKRTWPLDGCIRAIVEHGRSKATVARWPERFEQLLPQRRVVERVQEVAFGRVGPPHVADRSRVVKTVHRSPNDFSA